MIVSMVSAAPSSFMELEAREDLTLEELVAASEQLLQELALEQSRYRVTETPDARTIRYYVSQKLLPRPTSYEGGRARYGAMHVARLLLIKKLQAEHHTLRKIRALLEGLDDAAVRRQLWAGGEATATPVTAEDTRSPSSKSLARFALPGGGNLDAPSERLGDEDSRRALAEELEALARQLRTSSSQS